MIPQILTDWSKARLVQLLDQGLFEPESFDFKEFRLAKKTPHEKQDIRTDCCAFANSFGGFLVYGVADDKRLPAKERLIGIDKTFDFPKDFGEFPRECMPSIRWEFLNPPIDVGNGKVVHVIWIPRSWQGPHSIPAEKPEQGFVFPKRTNKGNEYMSYEEVRMSFLGYYEKRIKLQLLQAELKNIVSDAEVMMDVPDKSMSRMFPSISFYLTTIETVIVDTYTITHERPDLLESIMAVRSHARNINHIVAMFQSEVIIPTLWKGTMIKRHNEKLRQVCPSVIASATRAVEILQDFLTHEKPGPESIGQGVATVG